VLSRYPRALGIANATVLLVAVLSIGQVSYSRDQDNRAGNDTSLGFDSAGDSPSDGETASPTTGDSGKPGKHGRQGRHDGGGTGDQTRGGNAGPTDPGPTATSNPTGNPEPRIKVPDFGLRTQGVTKDSVLIGIDYNKSGCGGAGALAAQFGTAVTGDNEKAIATFVRYINDTGGIRGRKLKYVTVDDGGLGCPERHQAAAIQLVEQDKVFMDIAGLHEVSDLLAPKHLPFYGGRSTLAEQARQGMGQFQLYQEAEGDFANWAAFGRHYLHADKNKPCFVHPDTDDFNNLEKLMVAAMSKQGLKFGDIIRYADDASTAQQQATTYSIRMSREGCKSVWLLANNFLADVFFTNAAAQQNWHPVWTWTARTAGIDVALGGRLMQQSEWENAVGLTTRIKPGASPYEGNCQRIYNKYHAGDGQSGSAAVIASCNAILTVAEAMRRAVDRTGVLTGNSLMLGVDAIRGDFSWDAFVPLTYSILGKPRDFTGYDLQTVAKWNRQRQDYDFPQFPTYWKVMGPSGSNGLDIRTLLHKTYRPPSR
jgi:ABC-type branched-subunit amino acid transport system substrate-binding protein